MITQSLACSRQLANDITFARYKGAPKVKLNSESYNELARSMHLSGKINVPEVLLRNHKHNPYQSVDEVLGDLQLILVESWNEFKKVNHSPEMGRLSIEELVNELPKQNPTVS